MRRRKARRERIRAAIAAAAFVSTPANASEAPDENGFRLLRVGGDIVKWGRAELGAGATVTYSFLEEATQYPDARNCTLMAPVSALASGGVARDAFEEEARSAFAMWSAAADVRFRPATSGEIPDITIGVHSKTPGPAFADVLPQAGVSGVKSLARGLVCVNGDEAWRVDSAGGDGKSLRYALAHEIGHALGLDHAGAEGALMAFRYTEGFTTLQAGDIDGVRALYGERKTVAAAPVQRASP